MNYRSIIHLNVADFAVAVERVIDGRLKSRPVIIAPQGAPRASVFDMSEEAYKSGVRKGMSLSKALRTCRDASVLSPHPDRYERAMRELLKRAMPYSPLVEQSDANGHLFIDVTGCSKLFGPAYDVAWRIRKTVRAELGLDPIWSAASNKLVAKAATRVVKPTGEYILMEGEEQMFLNPLPVHLLPGLEREDLLSMRDFRLFKVRQLVEWTFPQLETIFKNRAGFIYQTARGIDETDVLPAGQRPPVASGERDFGDDTNDVDVIESALYAIVEKICFEIRERRLAARRVNVAIDYSDGGRIKRGLALPRPTSNDSKVFEAVKKALAMAWTRRARIRHIKITADRLVYPSALSDMFAGMDEAESSNNRLIKAVDDIRRKFGSDALQMGRTFKMNER